MNKEEIFEELDATRERLLMALEQLPDEAYYEPGVMDDWSTADILTHLIAWESELVTALQRIKQGKKPARILAALNDVDGYNKLRFEENKGREIDRIFSDLRGLRVQLEEWLTEFNTGDLNDTNRFDWSEGHALWMLVEGNSFGHEQQHIPDIERFSAKWRSADE